jgi:hypothetical protein
MPFPSDAEPGTTRSPIKKIIYGRYRKVCGLLIANFKRKERHIMLNAKSIPLACACVILFAVGAAHAQSASPSTTPSGRLGPTVLMRVTLPDGQTRELRAADSDVAVVTLKDGTEIGFGPVIQDSKPWTRVTIRIFKMATAKMSTQQLGDVTVKTGEPAIESQTTPAFKIAVAEVKEG